MIKFEQLQKYCEIILDGGVVKLERRYLNSLIDNLICYETDLKLDVQFNQLNDGLVEVKYVR